MPKYPEVITEDELKKQEHISDESIEQDYRETIEEISDLDKKKRACELLASITTDVIGDLLPRPRVAQMIVESIPAKVQERTEFAVYLMRLKAARELKRKGDAHASP